MRPGSSARNWRMRAANSSMLASWGSNIRVRHGAILHGLGRRRTDALVGQLPWGVPYWAASDGEETHVTASEKSAAPLERRREESARTTEPIAVCTGSPGCPCPSLIGRGRGAELHEGGPVGWASHRRHRRALGGGLQPHRPGRGGAAPRRWPPGLLW